MKKLFAFLAVFGMLTFGASTLYSQEESVSEEVTTTEAAVEEAVEAAPVAVSEPAAADEQGGLHKQLKIKFVEGGVPWMMPILIFLILGLAICIERIIYLNLSDINSKKLLQRVEAELTKVVLKLQRKYAAIHVVQLLQFSTKDYFVGMKVWK